MLSFTGGLKVMVAVEACEMRKGFNGLAALVSERLSEDVRGGTITFSATIRALVSRCCIGMGRGYG